MSFTDSGINVGSAAAKFAIGIVLAVLVKAAVTIGMAEYRRRNPDLGREIEQMKIRQPEMGALFQSLETSFPADYRAMIALIEARVKAGATSAEVKALSATWMRDFMSRHRQELAQAPSANLQAFRAAQMDAVDALKNDSEALCAHFITNGLQATDQPKPAAVAALGVAGKVQLDAIVAGTKSPTLRPAEMQQPDAIALIQQMRKNGASEQEMTMFGSPTGLTNAEPSVQCTVGRVMMKSISQLPTPQADRLTAYILSHA